MAETAADRAEAVQTMQEAVKELDPAAQVAAVEAVVPAPDAQTTKTLWIILVGGLVAALILALVGLIYLGKEEIDGSDVALTAFTALLTGLIGLFSPSPVKAGGASK